MCILPDFIHNGQILFIIFALFSSDVSLPVVNLTALCILSNPTNRMSFTV